MKNKKMEAIVETIVKEKIVNIRKIMLGASKAYIKSQRRLGMRKAHSHEAITAAWLYVDGTLKQQIKNLKE